MTVGAQKASYHQAQRVFHFVAQILICMPDDDANDEIQVVLHKK
jgi:hypothetical protein